MPASSEREKISFNQINKNTGNRIRYRKVDAETGEEVDSSVIIKGYEVGVGEALPVSKPNVAVASGCFRVGLTRLINEQDIRTPQHIKNRARNESSRLI